MKHAIRTLALVILIAALSLTVLGAQEASEDLLVGSVVLYAESGTFEDNGDDTYTLTLEDVDEYTPWIANLPVFDAGFYDTFAMSEEWALAPDGIVGMAVLAFEDEPDTGIAAISLVFGEPVYDKDEETFTFLVEIVEFTMIDSNTDTTKVEAPDSFDYATLIIYLDDALSEAWTVGSEARAEGTRDTSTNCTPKPRCN